MAEEQTTPARFDALIGTGGIGSGLVFAIEGNHTLGREESRGGRFLDRQDYCKLHIIAHGVRLLMPSRFQVFPIGKVGMDEEGGRLLEMMRNSGMDLEFTGRCDSARTLNCVCFAYPDGAGGNLTATDSASSRLAPADIRAALPVMRRFGGRGIALAAPEVPLEARHELLRLATGCGMFRAAAFLSAEMPEVLAAGMLEQVDLLALNADEAAMLLGRNSHAAADALAAGLAAKLAPAFPTLAFSMTAGSRGSWCFSRGDLRHEPVVETPVAATAGAGDAHLGGILAGLAEGLSLFDAHQIGALNASHAVTSEHSIHPDISRGRLLELARAAKVRLSGPVAAFLNPDSEVR